MCGMSSIKAQMSNFCMGTRCGICRIITDAEGQKVHERQDTQEKGVCGAVCRRSEKRGAAAAGNVVVQYATRSMYWYWRCRMCRKCRRCRRCKYCMSTGCSIFRISRDAESWRVH